ncbi:MAG: hypothetical protein ACT4O9_09925 [Blastocatellia bacterium]
MFIFGSIENANMIRRLTLAFRRSTPQDEPVADIEDYLADDLLPGILCPLCEWRPLRSSLWTCWDCDYPEYFYNGCGTDWNTFETGGHCPTCGHQWIWTSCLRCAGWSKHEDWYVQEE